MEIRYMENGIEKVARGKDYADILLDRDFRLEPLGNHWLRRRGYRYKLTYMPTEATWMSKADSFYHALLEFLPVIFETYPNTDFEIIE